MSKQARNEQDPSANSPGIALLVVQQIRTIWSSPAYAGPGRERGGVPEALAIPLHRCDRSTYAALEHRFQWSEFDRSSPVIEQVVTHPDLQRITLGCVRIEPGEHAVEVNFDYSQLGGAPSRAWASKTFLVSAGEWIQIAYNGRFAGESIWWYEKMVVNAGLFASVSGDRFTSGPATQRYAVFSKLW